MSDWRLTTIAVFLVCAGSLSAAEEPAVKSAAIPSKTTAPASARSEGGDYFESNVRPLLAAHCQKCHGANKHESGLRLDRRDGFLHGGDDGPVVVPGDAQKSLLIQAVQQTGDIKMPPKSKLSDPEIAMLTEWVNHGAAWPEEKSVSDVPVTTDQPKQHWAFLPVRAPAMPKVRQTNWIQTPVDSFVLAKLEAAGIVPSPPVDRRTLIRRATFDLLGLPPTPEQTEAFVADTAPDAYARLIDRLLESLQYGERWGRYWLDVARYADTKGYVFKEERKYPFSYTYRDWVVGSLNADLPYDQFLLEQIAADLLPRKDDRSLAAMGFLTLGRRFLNHRPDIIDDRLDVIFRGTQGLTVTCARCHDHKFDPIPTDDYYSLYGVLDCSVDKTVPLSPPTKEYEAELKRRQDSLASFVAEQREASSEGLRTKTFDYLLAASRTLSDAKAAPEQKEKSKDKLVPVIVIHWRDYLEAERKASARIWEPLFLAAEDFGKFSSWFDGASAEIADGRAGGRAEGKSSEIIKSVNPILLTKLKTSKPTNLDGVVRCYADVLGDIDKQWKQAQLKMAVQYATPPKKLARADEEELRLVLYGEKSPTNVSQDGLNDLVGKGEKEELKRRTEAIDGWMSSPEAPPQALVINDADVKKQAHVLVRGNPNLPGKAVPREFLALLSPSDRKPFHDGSGRLEMARQIVSPENPLTARVMVNRVWMNHFGAPLVSTPSDFGMRCESPSNPELLDYLASQFTAEGWSIKNLHRSIMLSAVYQQASASRPEAEAIDPENRLVWKMNRRRLDWEAMRDALLSAAGNLDLKPGGPPVDVLAEPFSHRRSLYGFIDRQNLPGVFRTFDLATPDTHSPRRFTTTVPPQALYLMNNAFVVEAARQLASRQEVRAAAGDDERVRQLFMFVFERPATDEEVQLAKDFLKTAADKPIQSESDNQAADAKIADNKSVQKTEKLDRWERLAQALLMTNEFVYID